MLAAIAADGSEKAFVSVCEALMEDIRANKDGIAKRIKAPVAKKPGKDGEQRFSVPSALSSAKSHIASALRHGIELIEDDEPRSFGAIRKDAMAANELERRENESVEERQRREIGETCDALVERAGKLDGTALDALHTTITDLYTALNGAAEQADKAAAALEEAATAKPAAAKARKGKATAEAEAA